MFVKLFPKCLKLKGKFHSRMLMTIGTHSGKFHTDEALACFFLKSIPEFSNAEIVRSRNMEILNKIDILVDVGGVYNHEKRRYDHHQKTFEETMASLKVLPSFNTKLSSAGLIYAHYGKRIISEILNISPNDSSMDDLFYFMYLFFVESVDAIDNGVNCYDCPPKYIVPESLSSRVNDLMPYWNSTKSNDEDYLYEQFMKAIQLVGTSFTNKLESTYYSWLPAKNIVKEALEKRFLVHSTGQIIYLDKGSVPWKSQLLILEKELCLNEKDISFVVYKDEINNRYKVQAIPLKNEDMAFENRALLKKEWRGLDREKLKELSKINDIEFVHVSGFIGGANSLESVIEMAVRSLN